MQCFPLGQIPGNVELNNTARKVVDIAAKASSYVQNVSIVVCIGGRELAITIYNGGSLEDMLKLGLLIQAGLEAEHFKYRIEIDEQAPAQYAKLIVKF